MDASTPRTDARRTDTRERIRAVALQLFAEQGYEKTSLREIAEQLGVTKAAVYYHFRTKEEIVASVLDAQVNGIGEIMAWAEQNQPGPERNQGIIERYSALLASGGGTGVVRFIEESQTSVRDLGVGAEIFARLRALGEMLVVPGGDFGDQIRARLALVALHFGAFRTNDTSEDGPARRAAALTVALDLAVRRPGPAGSGKPVAGTP